MCTKKISIIVPVYNTEKYLATCIQSVINQTYNNWELILINDGSEDNSENICRSFAEKDERIILISQENRGVSAARNTGIAHATGEYLMFVDSDDTLEPNAIDVLLSNIIQYDADISSATQYLVTAEGKKYCNNNDGLIMVYQGEEMIRRSLEYASHTHSLHAQLIRSSFMKDIIFAEGHHINEDGYFLFECYTKKPKSVQHNIAVYTYYFRESSSSRGRFSKKYFDMLYFCNLKKQYIQENMPHLMDDAKNMEVRTHLLFLQVLCRTNDKQYNDAQKKSVETVRRLHRYYRPISRHHKLLVQFVVLGLYPLYKAMVRFKYNR